MPEDTCCFSVRSHLGTHQAREDECDWTDVALTESLFPLLRDLSCPLLIPALPTGPLPV